MARALKREAAKRDLIHQWIWYEEISKLPTDSSPLWRALYLLATQPDSGAPFPVRATDLREMRRFPVSGGFEKILLFYFPLKDGIDLVRLVHGSRDLEGPLSEGFFG
jgi:hypothetical protein